MQHSNISKILVVNPYGLGDVLFSSPLIRTLKKHYPKSYIGMLLGSRTESLFEFNPDVDALYTYNKDYVKNLPLSQRTSFLWNLLRKIKRQQFDCLIDLSNTDEYAFLARFLWRIPLRIGFQFKRRGRHLTHKIKFSKKSMNSHIVNHYFRLFEYLDIDPTLYEKRLFFYKSPHLGTWLSSFKETHRLKPDDLIISILPGGGASWGNKAHYRYWPTTYYAELICKLVQECQAKIILLGSKADQFLSDEILQHIRQTHGKKIEQHITNASGKTDIHQLAILMTESRLIIGNESGPLHMATALDRPSIFLFGPVDPKVYGPYSIHERQRALHQKIPCSFCYQDFRIPDCSNRLCLKSLSAQTVFNTARSMLETHR